MEGWVDGGMEGWRDGGMEDERTLELLRKPFPEFHFPL